MLLPTVRCSQGEVRSLVFGFRMSTACCECLGRVADRKCMSTAAISLKRRHHDHGATSIHAARRMVAPHGRHVHAFLNIAAGCRLRVEAGFRNGGAVPHLTMAEDQFVGCGCRSGTAVEGPAEGPSRRTEGYLIQRGTI